MNVLFKQWENHSGLTLVYLNIANRSSEKGPAQSVIVMVKNI